MGHLLFLYLIYFRETFTGLTISLYPSLPLQYLLRFHICGALLNLIFSYMNSLSMSFLLLFLEIRNRRIVIPASAFDSKVKFLEKTRKSFGGGTFNINEGALLENYYLFLKEEYNEGVPRQYFAAECIGLQKSKNDYWCLSSEVCVISIQFAMCSSKKYPYPLITMEAEWKFHRMGAVVI